MQKLSFYVSFQIWQAKFLLSKAMFFPQLTYTARIYFFDIASQRVVETEFLNHQSKIVAFLLMQQFLLHMLETNLLDGQFVGLKKFQKVIRSSYNVTEVL